MSSEKASIQEVDLADARQPHLARAAGSNWIKTWLVALGCLAALVAVHEFQLRRQGFRPGIVDDQELWCVHRDRVYGGEKTFVLVGASRVQLGFSSDVFSKWFPDYRFVQLAVDGSRGLAAFLDLANDPKFKGTVLYSARAPVLIPRGNDVQQEYVNYYHQQWNSSQRVERQFSAWLQERFALIHPSHRLEGYFRSIVLDQSAAADNTSYVRTLGDRTRQADYRSIDVLKLRASRLSRVVNARRNRPPLNQKEWLSKLTDLRVASEKIQQRGGQAVFVRFPTTEQHWRLDERMAPRARFWDELAGVAGAPTIHFRDLPTRYLDCPDTSHFDQRDAPVFTAALVRELMRQGLLPERPQPESLKIPDRQFWSREWRLENGGRLVGQFLGEKSEQVAIMVEVPREALSWADNSYVDSTKTPASKFRRWSLGQRTITGSLLASDKNRVRLGMQIKKSQLGPDDVAYVDSTFSGASGGSLPEK